MISHLEIDLPKNIFQKTPDSFWKKDQKTQKTPDYFWKNIFQKTPDSFPLPGKDPWFFFPRLPTVGGNSPTVQKGRHTIGVFHHCSANCGKPGKKESVVFLYCGGFSPPKKDPWLLFPRLPCIIYGFAVVCRDWMNAEVFTNGFEYKKEQRFIAGDTYIFFLRTIFFLFLSRWVKKRRGLNMPYHFHKNQQLTLYQINKKRYINFNPFFHP